MYLCMINLLIIWFGIEIELIVPIRINGNQIRNLMEFNSKLESKSYQRKFQFIQYIIWFKSITKVV